MYHFFTDRPTLKVLIFASTNFRENLFSREFIFAIWTTIAKFAKISSREIFEDLHFREIRENLFSRNFAK